MPPLPPPENRPCPPSPHLRLCHAPPVYAEFMCSGTNAWLLKLQAKVHTVERGDTSCID